MPDLIGVTLVPLALETAVAITDLVLETAITTAFLIYKTTVIKGTTAPITEVIILITANTIIAAPVQA